MIVMIRADAVQTRRMWYTRDDSEGIAQSITHLMPPGTETSMAMPVFGFDGQVSRPLPLAGEAN